MSIELRYLWETEEIEFVTQIPDNTYLAIGFGKDMTDVDMLAWHANIRSGSTIGDYWSEVKAAPEMDASIDLKVVSIEAADDGSSVRFVTTRKLDTGDAEKDFLIQLGEEIDMNWAVSLYTSDWVRHDFRDKFRITFDKAFGNDPATIPDQTEDTSVVEPYSTESEDSASDQDEEVDKSEDDKEESPVEE